MTQPWLKFYPTDWRADPRLRMCSLAARGLWIDLITYMHEADPYGHLTINSVAPSIEDISSLVGRPLAEVRRAMAELEARQVLSRDDAGTIYSRRMVRDKAKAERDKANGKAGGNPKITTPVNEGVNPPVNGEDKAQKPDTRSQISQEEGSLRSPTRKRARDAGAERGTRLPADWQPTAADWAMAEMALGPEGAKLELANFRDYWAGVPGQRGRKSNWDGTWRNRVRDQIGRAATRRPAFTAANPRPGSREDTRERTANAYDQLSRYADTHADDEEGSGGAAQADVGLLPLAQPARP